MPAFRPFLLVLLALFLLPASGCEQAKKVKQWATNEEEYHFLPPDTVNGRKCAAMCPTREQQCGNLCVAEHNNCRYQLKLTAQRQHLAYVDNQMARGQLVEKTAADFWSEAVTKSCPPIASCQERCKVGLRYCHTQCGGRVVKGEECVSNCDKISYPDAAPDEPDWL